MVFQCPINDVTKLDVIGKRKDGGLDLGIVANASIDGSSATLDLVERKVRNYIREALDESFRQAHGVQQGCQIRILFESKYALAPSVVELLSSLGKEAAASGMEIIVRQY